MNLHIYNFVFSVFLYPKNDPTVPVMSEADEDVTEGNDGKYELFNQVDKQIKEGIKNLIDNCKFSGIRIHVYTCMYISIIQYFFKPLM